MNPIIQKIIAAGGIGAIGAGAALALTLLDRKSILDAFGTSLYMPTDLGSDKHPHYISFSFRHYQRRSIFDQPFLDDVGMIRLPLPNVMVDAQEVSYNQTDNSLIGGAVIENLLSGSRNLTDVGKNIAAGAGAAGGFATATTLSLISDKALQLGGLAQNPFLTVLFKAPSFKRHQFQWTFAPNNEKETELLVNIVNKFKYHQLPGLSHATAGTLLSYPDMAIVKLFPNDRYLYKFKPCVIEGFSVNYTPEGQPAFFSTKDAPALITIQLSLLEIEYWTKDDVLKAQGINIPSNFFTPPTPPIPGTNDMIFQ